MQTQTLDGENTIYAAVADLDATDINRRLRENASRMGMELGDEHLEVIQVLIEHYRQDCEQNDCRAASPHMRFLVDRFADRGGSRYLYRLFDGMDGNAPGSREDRRELGVLTLIHRLAGLPDLTHNEDDGFGTVI